MAAASLQRRPLVAPMPKIKNHGPAPLLFEYKDGEQLLLDAGEVEYTIRVPVRVRLIGDGRSSYSYTEK